jgi:hypothetical protein
MVRAIRAGSLGSCPLRHDSEVGERTARALPAAIPRLPGHTTPDIIFLPGLEEVRLITDHLSQLTAEERTIVCIEVGHATDGRLAEKMEAKIGQHEGWMDHLTAEGWTVHYFPVVVSHSGLVSATATAALQQCGVAPRAAAATVKRIARHALDYNCKFRNARRALCSPNADQRADPGG